MTRLILENIASIDESARISGIALVPRISRNGNLYTKSEMQKAHGQTVPLNWEHDPSKKIGSITFSYNRELEQLFYEGVVTDESAAQAVRNRQLWTSIEADVDDVREICNGPNDCFRMPVGLVWRGMALTEMPGVPETSVSVIEKFVNFHSGVSHVCKNCDEQDSNSSLSGTLTQLGSMTNENNTKTKTTTKEQECPDGHKFDDDAGKCVPINGGNGAKEGIGPDDQAAGVDQTKPDEQPCGPGMKLVDGQCVPADNTDGGSPVSTGPKEARDCGCNKSREQKTWIPNVDDINQRKKEHKELIDNLKNIINETTEREVQKLKTWEEKDREKRKQEMYQVARLSTTGAGINSFAQDDIQFIAQEGRAQLKKFGSYAFDIDLSNEWVKEHLSRQKVQEAISFSGDQSNKQAVMNDVYVLPGGKYMKPIRDLVRFKEIPQGVDQIKFFKGDIPDQGTRTEGSTTTASTHTLTTITLSADTVTGVAQSIKGADIEDSPFEIFDYVAQTARAEALEHEATLVFDTAADAATAGLWLDGSANDATLTADDATTVGALIHQAVARGLQHFETQGYPTDFGAIGFALHPKALRELRIDSNLVRLVQEGDANITKTGRLTHLYGIELIPTTAVKAQDNTTTDTYRNVMFLKGHTFALGSKRDLTIDMRKIPSDSAFDWAWSQRKNATTFDATSFVRISTGQ